MKRERAFNYIIAGLCSLPWVVGVILGWNLFSTASTIFFDSFSTLLVAGSRFSLSLVYSLATCMIACWYGVASNESIGIRVFKSVALGFVMVAVFEILLVWALSPLATWNMSFYCASVLLIGVTLLVMAAERYYSHLWRRICQRSVESRSNCCNPNE